MPEPIGVEGSGFRIRGAQFRVQGSGFRVLSPGFRAQGSGFRRERLGGLGCRGRGPVPEPVGVEG